MHKDTRVKFTAFVSQVALLSCIAAADASKSFAVAPQVAEKVEDRIKELSEFLTMINMLPVINQSGRAIGVESTRPIAGRTDTSGNNRRQPTDPSDSSIKNTYECKKTEFDWSRRYELIDAWRHLPDFEIKLRDAIMKQQGRDRIMIGWNGTSCADATNRALNPMLQDVNEGWLHKIRTNAAAQVLSDGSLTVRANGANNAGLKAIYVKPGVTLFDVEEGNAVTADADYSSLDALVLDAKSNIPEWYRGDTDLVVIIGHDLVDEKYFTIAQQTGATATEVEATDRILRSDKQLGGFPVVRVPFFPANAILITKLSNLSIYWQEGTRRRKLVDEDEYDRVANYESVNEAYVVEEYDLVSLVENIVIGGAPARPV